MNQLPSLTSLATKTGYQLALHAAPRTTNVWKTSANYKKICMDYGSDSIYARCPLSTGKSLFNNRTLLFQQSLNCITYFNFCIGTSNLCWTLCSCLCSTYDNPQKTCPCSSMERYRQWRKIHHSTLVSVFGRQ